MVKERRIHRLIHWKHLIVNRMKISPDGEFFCFVLVSSEEFKTGMLKLCELLQIPTKFNDTAAILRVGKSLQIIFRIVEFHRL